MACDEGGRPSPVEGWWWGSPVKGGEGKRKEVLLCGAMHGTPLAGAGQGGHG